MVLAVPKAAIRLVTSKFWRPIVRACLVFACSLIACAIARAAIRVGPPFSGVA